MTELVTALGIFALGAVFGVILVRYGIGLGFKAIFQAKEDETLSGWGQSPSEPIEQSSTSGEEELGVISPDEYGIPNSFPKDVPIKQKETM